MRRLALTTAGVIALGSLTALTGLTATPALAAVRTVTYPLPVVVPDAGSTTATLDVANLPGTITDVDVVLNNVHYSYPQDLDLYLRAPGSTKVVKLLSDVCGTSVTPLAGSVLTVDDEAGISFPVASACPTGSYRPTNADTVGDTDLVPPGTTFAASLSAFDGGNPNGAWTLYASDDLGLFSGQLAGGFSLVVTTDDAPGHTTITSHPRKRTRSHRATIGFSADKTNVTFQCKVDDKAWKACTSPLTLKRLKVGKHKVRVRSVGASGQLEATPAVFKWRVRR
ncbi:hypothetical protein FHP29_20680 [Nocardioides albidus]|uniref:P/Homo B domain-containing protein n=1 Tax=Nocardioides albidus TaxID=1517589 RepID=A0A5C4VL26_9ACTN|nr:hypothetical protein [Nocardioides albidus]TNM36548.1 hypothetical protein FHP29_20680 [Nocardioides albidus]